MLCLAEEALLVTRVSVSVNTFQWVIQEYMYEMSLANTMKHLKVLLESRG